MVIKPKSDDVPNHVIGGDYTTNPFDLDDDVNAPTPACTVTIDESVRGQATKGTFNCVNLRSADITPKNALGVMISISGKWRCEKYR